MCLKILCAILAILLLSCVCTGCAEQVNKMELPDFNVSTEENFFPPSVQEYGANGENAFEESKEKVKSKIERAWYHFLNSL